MLGTIINTGAIIGGGLLGLLLRKGIPESYKNTIMHGIGLCVLVIGFKGVFKSQDILLMIISVVFGSIIGEAVRIEDKLEKLGMWLEGNMGKKHGAVAKGFVTSSLIYCVGAMAIIGSLESGLTGNHQTLYVKSLLDGFSAIIFSSTMGIGVVFSSIAVFVYQGFITLTAAYIKPFLTENVVREMSAVGGLLIMGISFNILGFKRIHVGNMLPSIFFPMFYIMIKPYLMKLYLIFQNIL